MLNLDTGSAPELLSTYNLIKRAFPNGINTSAYLPLLVLLDEEMSDRNLAEVVAQYTGKEYEIVFNDLYRVKSTDIPSQASIAKIKQLLLASGYQEWLEE